MPEKLRTIQYTITQEHPTHYAGSTLTQLLIFHFSDRGGHEPQLPWLKHDKHVV